jgi:hypothetical protein
MDPLVRIEWGRGPRRCPSAYLESDMPEGHERSARPGGSLVVMVGDGPANVQRLDIRRGRS